MKAALLGVWHVHARDYVKYALKLADVVGAWDEDPAKLAPFCEEFQVPAFSSIDELLASDAEAVICCSSSDTHPDVMVKAAEAGKHIFTEKVLALSSAECEKIEAAVKKNGVNFVISLVQKYTAGPSTVKALLDSGELGEINYFRFRNCHNGSTGNWLPEHFFSKKECGGGAMIDLGAHGMYLANWFLGIPESAKSVFTVWDKNVRNIDHLEDNAVTVMSYPGGVIAINETGFDSIGSPMRLEIGGSKGYAVCEDGKVYKNLGKGFEAVELLPARPLPIEQFLTGNILPGCGIEEAKHLTKLMEMAYQNQ